MLRILLIAVLSAGCSQANLRRVNYAALAASSAAIACDWGYTRRAAIIGWEPELNFYETNPIMGPTPTTTEIGAYFITALALNAALWTITPERYRAPIPVGVVAVQTPVLLGNSKSVGGVCGF